MLSTSASLLNRLQEPEDQRAWEQFVELYAPLIFHWGRRHGLSETDAADLVQEVMTVLVVKLPEFQYDPNKRFRSWLRTVTLNTARTMHRRRPSRALASLSRLAQQPEAAPPDDLFEEQEYRSFLIQRALELMRRHFQETTWRACWEHVVHGRPAAEVARELGLSTNAVYIAKYRVLRRLRQELEGLLD